MAHIITHQAPPNRPSGCRPALHAQPPITAYLNVRVGVTDSAPIVGYKVWNASLAEGELYHLAELVLSFLSSDTVCHEAALGIVQNAEELVGPLNGHDIHETHGILVVGAYFTIHLNQALHQNVNALLHGQCVPAGQSVRHCSTQHTAV